MYSSELKTKLIEIDIAVDETISEEKRDLLKYYMDRWHDILSHRSVPPVIKTK